MQKLIDLHGDSAVHASVPSSVFHVSKLVDPHQRLDANLTGMHASPA